MERMSISTDTNRGHSEMQFRSFIYREIDTG